jgi:galactokinase
VNGSRKRAGGEAPSPAAAAAFFRLVGRPPEGVWSAPGRVNLIGDHTDYNGGLCLPFAVGLRTAVAAARRTDGAVRAWSGQEATEVVVAPEALQPGGVGGWGAYVAGVVWALRSEGAFVGGMDVVVEGRVPSGSGLSSSAALQCAAALAASDLYGLELDLPAVAAVAHRAETEFVGVPCGLMDQTVVTRARPGHAVLFDARSNQSRLIPFQPSAAGLELLVIDTGAGHRHASGAYAERRRQCDEAARGLGVGSLREIGMEDLDEASWRLRAQPCLGRRVRHVVTENDRTRRVAAALSAGQVASMGPVLSESHRSLALDFEVSAPQLDTAVDAACGGGALGARLTGGGFGGCAIALCPQPMTEAVDQAVRYAARRAGHQEPVAWVEAAGGPARRDG